MKLKLLTLSLLIATSLIAKEDRDGNKSTNPFLKALVAEAGAVVTAYAEEEKRLDAEEKRLDKQIAEDKAKIAQIEKEIAEIVTTHPIT